MVDTLEALKALNNRTRLDILRWLKDPKRHFDLSDQLIDAEEFGVCVSIIQQRSGLSQSTISSYLSVLQRAGLLTSSRNGTWTYYKRNEKVIAEFLEQLGNAL